MCSIPGIFSSSTKMPFPLTRRFSSFRRMGWPTHLAGAACAPFVDKPREAPRTAFFLLPFATDLPAICVSALSKCLLQSVNQFLHILLPQRLKQASRQRNHAAQHARLARPFHLRLSTRQLFELKLCANRSRTAGHFALPLVGRLRRAMLIHQSQLDGRRPSNMRNTHTQLYQEILRIDYLYTLKIGKQRTKPVRVHQEVVNLLGSLPHREVAGQLNLQSLPLLHFRSRHSNGLENVLIACAAASISCDALANLPIDRPRIFLQQLQRRKQKSRRAITALQSVAFRKRFLNRMQLAVFRKTLDRGDFSAIGHG